MSVLARGTNPFANVDAPKVTDPIRGSFILHPPLPPENGGSFAGPPITSVQLTPEVPAFLPKQTTVIPVDGLSPTFTQESFSIPQTRPPPTAYPGESFAIQGTQPTLGAFPGTNFFPSQDSFVVGVKQPIVTTPPETAKSMSFQGQIIPAATPRPDVLQRTPGSFAQGIGDSSLSRSSSFAGTARMPVTMPPTAPTIQEHPPPAAPMVTEPPMPLGVSMAMGSGPAPMPLGGSMAMGPGPAPMPLGGSMAMAPMSFAPQSPGVPGYNGKLPPPIVGGHYASIHGTIPIWGPEILPPRRLGDPPPEPPRWEPFPDVGSDAIIPSSWMQYRHSGWKWENATKREPTIYRDALTNMPTTRSAMLHKKPSDLIGDLDEDAADFRAQLQEAILADQPLGELQKGLELIEHDVEGQTLGEMSKDFDKDKRRTAPGKVDGWNYHTQHGTYCMGLENPLKPKQNAFTTSDPEMVETYFGLLSKEVDPRKEEDCRIG